MLIFCEFTDSKGMSQLESSVHFSWAICMAWLQVPPYLTRGIKEFPVARTSQYHGEKNSILNLKKYIFSCTDTVLMILKGYL